jgi:hypothetical protein
MMGTMGRWKGSLVTLWIYFRRGHSAYVLLVLSLINFITIQYALLVQNYPEASRLFPNLVYFGVTLVLIYGPLSTLLGFLDYKAGSIPRESTVNPYTRTLARALQLIAQGRNREASDLLAPWTEEKALPGEPEPPVSRGESVRNGVPSAPGPLSVSFRGEGAASTSHNRDLG